jgi:hypothetical protein
VAFRLVNWTNPLIGSDDWVQINRYIEDWLHNDSESLRRETHEDSNTNAHHFHVHNLASSNRSMRLCIGYDPSKHKLSTASVQSNGNSFLPALNENGNFVAFHSFADNLVAGDTNQSGSGRALDVFVRNRQTGETPGRPRG